MNVAGFCLLAFLVFAFLSAINSSYPSVVFGYCWLLAGTIFASIGLVEDGNSPTRQGLAHIERVWLWVMTALLMKDAIHSLFLGGTLGPDNTDDVFRLGMGVIDAVGMGLTASVAFILTFSTTLRKKRLLCFLLRTFYITIILLTRFRGPLVCLGLALVSMHVTGNRARKYWDGQQWKGLIAGGAIAAASICALWLQTIFAPINLLAFLSRGQTTAELDSLTGQTDIWRLGAQHIFDTASSVITGHGFGVSRLALANQFTTLGYAPSHLHNTFLEMVFDMGVPGGFLYCGVIVISARWLFRHREMCAIYGTDCARRAVAVTIIILINSITEESICAQNQGH